MNFWTVWVSYCLLCAACASCQHRNASGLFLSVLRYCWDTSPGGESAGSCVVFLEPPSKAKFLLDIQFSRIFSNLLPFLETSLMRESCTKGSTWTHPGNRAPTNQQHTWDSSTCASIAADETIVMNGNTSLSPSDNDIDALQWSTVDAWEWEWGRWTL